MRFSIQYQVASDEWVIVDTCGEPDLVATCRTEKEVLLAVLNLQEKIRVKDCHLYDDSQLIA